MSYNVDGWNNFCRVFEFPDKFSSDFCFGGGHPTNFQMVDWFNPVPGIGQPAVTKEVWKTKVGKIEQKEVTEQELKEKLIPFLQGKDYIDKNKRYLVICEFGLSFTFKGRNDDD